MCDSCVKGLMPLFHRRYQLISPGLGLVPGTSCFHLEYSTSSTWAGRHGTHERNCSDTLIHETHNQTGLHTGASLPLAQYPACSIINHYS